MKCTTTSVAAIRALLPPKHCLSRLATFQKERDSTVRRRFKEKSLLLEAGLEPVTKLGIQPCSTQ